MSAVTILARRELVRADQPRQLWLEVLSEDLVAARIHQAQHFVALLGTREAKGVVRVGGLLGNEVGLVGDDVGLDLDILVLSDAWPALAEGLTATGIVETEAPLTTNTAIDWREVECPTAIALHLGRSNLALLILGIGSAEGLDNAAPASGCFARDFAAVVTRH